MKPDELGKNYLFNLYPGISEKNIPLEKGKRKDPDQRSKELYDDLCEIFFDDDSKEKLKITSVCNKYQNSSRNLSIDEGKHTLSSDYIGASINLAKKAVLNDDEILKHLRISRTIGGHILFPKGKNKDRDKNIKLQTVNQARGFRYYDRFDLTLYAIKEWFVGNKDTKIAYAIENYHEWFELFFDNNRKNGFENFIEFFKLEGFINEQNKIIDLINSDLEKNKVVPLDKEYVSIAKTKKDYIKYMKILNIIISKRTEKILS